jgi:hypothetical protein
MAFDILSVREVSPIEKRYQREKIFEEYPRCPSLGAFLMRVFDSTGNPIEKPNECKNDYPSSRF